MAFQNEVPESRNTEMALDAPSLSPLTRTVTRQPLPLEAESISAPENLGWLHDLFWPIE